MPPERVETAEGHELTLATHVLGPHELTKRLPATDRIVWVSSGGMYAQKLKVDDLEYLKGQYKPVTAYARTKRMIEEALYGYIDEVSTNSIEAQIYKLRQALRTAGAAATIETRRGIGYRLVELKPGTA